MQVPRRAGFALIEAVALVIVTATVAALLLLLGGETRRQGRLGEDIGKLQRIVALTQEYAADNADLFWTFSWKKGQALSQFADLNNAPTDLQAASNQAVDILRRRTGRLEIPAIQVWFAHTYYSQLPLLDYAERVPDETFISAADSNRLKWSRDPQGFDQGLYQPAPVGVPGNSSMKRWPYSATFQLGTAFFDKSEVPNRVYQATTHSQHFVPSAAVFGARLMPDVVHPAHKVMLSDANARHFGPKQPFSTHDEARLPLLFADGAVTVKAATESNPGWMPNQPCAPGPSVFRYQPDAWEPPTYSGLPWDDVIGRFRWTRGTLDGTGIAGRDFAGPETLSCPP